MTLRIQPTADGVRFGVEGAANDALVELLATTFGVRVGDVTIVAGAKARSKIVELRGVTEARVRQLMQP